MGADRVVFLLLAALPGCGGGSSDDMVDAAADAGPDAEVVPTFEPTPPEPPEPPASPSCPCAAGWRSVPDPREADITACEPWPVGGPVDCADDEAHFPGEPGCTRVGPSCPAGDFADDLPANFAVLYVKVDAGPDGDGSRERPFATIQQALDAASEDEETTIALGKGTFVVTSVSASKPARLWGACARETIVSSDDPNETYTAVHLSGRARGLHSLTITGERPGLRVGTRTAPAEIEGVVIRDVPIAGIVTSGRSQVVVHDALIRDVRRGPSGADGVGIQAETESSMEISRMALERAGHVGILALDAGTELVAEDIAIRDSQLTLDGSFGEAIEVVLEAHVELTRAAIERNHSRAVNITLDGSLVASDLHVAGTQPGRSGSGGVSLVVEHGRADLRCSLIEDGRAVGAWVNGPGAELGLHDVIVRDIEIEEQSGELGSGVEVAGEARAVLERVAILRATSNGVLASGDGTSLDISDLSVRGTREVRSDVDAAGKPFFGAEYGSGMAVQFGAQVHVERAALIRNVALGMVVIDASVDGSDWSIVDTGPEGAETDRGFGLVVQDAASVSVARLLAAGNRTTGAVVQLAGSTLEGTDVAILDTRADETGSFGDGIVLLEGGSASIDRLVLRGNRLTAIAAVGTGTTGSFQDVLIEDTLAQECAETTCEGASFGMGLGVFDGPDITLRRFRISASALCGVQVGDDAVLRLSEGEVSGNPIGANVQDEDYDLALLQDRVRWDNERNFDGSTLPVPSLSEIGDLL